MTERVTRAGLQVASELAEFLETQALPGSGVAVDGFWSGFAGLLTGFHAENQALLAKRAALQAQIDAWHTGPRGSAP